MRTTVCILKESMNGFLSVPFHDHKFLFSQQNTVKHNIVTFHSEVRAEINVVTSVFFSGLIMIPIIGNPGDIGAMIRLWEKYRSHC